nr:thioredoxin [Quercus suber]
MRNQRNIEVGSSSLSEHDRPLVPPNECSSKRAALNLSCGYRLEQGQLCVKQPIFPCDYSRPSGCPLLHDLQSPHDSKVSPCRTSPNVSPKTRSQPSTNPPFPRPQDMETLSDRTGYLRATQLSTLSVLQATTTWCPQCKAVAPAVEALRAKFPAAKFYMYDVERADDVAQELGVSQVPSFHVFRDGELLGSVTGAKAEALEKVVREGYDG